MPTGKKIMTNDEPIHHFANKIANIYIKSEKNANDKLKEDLNHLRSDILKGKI